ncbi:MAG: hypothetical protein WC310_00480 [Patescibacteria group bacterium]|jgi:hypothetical protein
MTDQFLISAIVKTLAFFDLFSFPLTAVEIWRYLYSDRKYSLEEVIAVLPQITLVGQSQGYYFLSSRDDKIVTLRKERYGIAEKKYRKVKKVCRFLAFLPFVRMIAVCNTLAYSNAADGSDIDLFIITRSKKAWTTRFFCLFFLKFFGLRPKENDVKDKFCLSFFVDEESMNLEKTALPRNDIYLCYWIDQLFPVYDADGCYYKKFQERNVWIKKYLANSIGVDPNLRRTIVLGSVGGFMKKSKEYFWQSDKMERWAQKMQWYRLPQLLKEKFKNKYVGVAIEEGLIKLISNDRREGYRNEWIIKVNELVTKLK